MKILFINELSPSDRRVGAVRMRELAKAVAKRGHHAVLFTTAEKSEDITDPNNLSRMFQTHDWTKLLSIQCGRKKSFFLKKLRQKSFPGLVKKAIIAFYYLFFFGLARDWSLGSKPYWKTLATHYSPDIIISTFGNTDGLIIAKKIAQLANAPWILDIKDSWEDFIPFGFRRYIARQFSDAACITTLAKFYLIDAEKWFSAIPRQVIYSGFSEKLLDNTTTAFDLKEKYQLFLVGSCYNRNHLRILLDGITQFTQHARVELHYMGNDQDVETIFSLYRKNFSILNHGQLLFDDYVSQLRTADIVCYIHWDLAFHHKSTELLAFQKPIICVPNEHQEAVQLANNSNIPLFQCENADSVTESLIECTEKNTSQPANIEFLKSLTWDAQAAHLIHCFEQVLGKKCQTSR